MKKLLLALLVIGTLGCVCLAGAIGLWLVRRSVDGGVVTEGRPLSNRIVFVGNDGNVWLVSPDDGELQSLTSDARGYRFPTWAPDGRRLAFVGPDNEGNPALYVSENNVSENTRSAPRILFNSRGSAPFYLYWSPDSRSVTFLTQESSSMAMRLADVESPGDHRIMAEGAPFYWVWSPEGDQLLMHVGGARAFSEDAHLSFLESREGADRVKLKFAPGQFQAPVWSTSGEYVLYIGSDGAGEEAIYRTDMATSRQTMVSSLNGPAFMVLSPDDGHLAYLEVQNTGRLPALGTATIVDTEGTVKRQVLNDWVAAMYWSPNGKKLALLTPVQGDEGPTARAHGLAALSAQRSGYRWWIYDVETELLELLASFAPTLEFNQTVPFFDQYHLSLTFWSPDSRYFVFTKSNVDTGLGTVWILDTTGREAPRQVGEGTFAAWSWK